MDEDPSDCKVGFLAVDALLVGVSTNSIGVVEKADMGGIGPSKAVVNCGVHEKATKTPSHMTNDCQIQ